MSFVGIMQGRLSPPVQGRIQAFPWAGWREEFPKAQTCGLNCIEWIFEEEKWQDNPLLTSPQELLDLSEVYNVKVISICADYFMDCPLIRVTKEQQEDRLAILVRLIAQAGKMGIRYIEIPFVDKSAIRTSDEADEVVSCLRRCLNVAEASGVQLALETSLGPSAFAEMMQALTHPNVKINYDIGNSASLGYDTTEEIQAYGKWIATVHIKDRVRNGSTVPLGDGQANFNATFAALAEIRYAGPFILQTARISGLGEIQTISKYLLFLQHYFHKYSFSLPSE